MELFLLYFWLKLDAIQTLLIYCTVFGGMGLFAYFLFNGIEYSNSWNEIAHRKKLIAIWLALVFTAVAMPSRTDVAILVGANYAFKVAETPEAQKAMLLLRTKANELMDEELQKMTKKENK